MLNVRKFEIKTKKLVKTKIEIKAILALIFVLFAANSVPFNLFAADTTQLKQEQQAKRAKLDELNKQIKQFQTEINTNLKQQNTLNNQIKIFNAQINQTTAQIQATETKIEVASDEISVLTEEIGVKEAHMQKTKASLAELIRQLYQLDQSNALVIALMNNDNLSDFFDQISQTENLQGRSYELLQEIKTLKQQLEDEKTEIERQKAELEELNADLNEHKKVLGTQVSNKNNLLVQTKGQESEYRKLLSKSEAEQSKIEQEIRDLENAIRKQLGQRTSPGRSGLFQMPLDGFFTQKYGNTGFTALGYNFHNGVDIYAPPGSPIYAPYDGQVVGIGTGQYAYGNWVTMKHNLPSGRCVISLYAHLSRINVSVGQELKVGDKLGSEGNTGNTTRLLYGPERGYHLHFTIFDCEGYRVADGAHGDYKVPTGYTYDPLDFL